MPRQEMAPREIVRRVIARDAPPRIGLQLHRPGYPKDIRVLPGLRLNHPRYRETAWGTDGGLRARAGGFPGEVHGDPWGNVWGRLDPVSKGECVRGVLEDGGGPGSGWEAADRWEMPAVEEGSVRDVRAAVVPGRWCMGMLPGMPFSIMRCMRGMETFLGDVLLAPAEVRRLSDRIVALLLRHVDLYAEAGADGVYAGEDWGTQEALLVSPVTWRALFGPAFRAVAERAHERGLKLVVHSCGMITDIIPDLVDAGVDVFQFDQPRLAGVLRLAETWGGRAAFWCPVDIQHVMPTGDRALIEAEARLMIRAMGGRDGRAGGFIGADYTQWEALGIPDEWAEWARQVFIREGVYPRGGA